MRPIGRILCMSLCGYLPVVCAGCIFPLTGGSGGGPPDFFEAQRGNPPSIYIPPQYLTRSQVAPSASLHLVTFRPEGAYLHWDGAQWAQDSGPPVPARLLEWLQRFVPTGDWRQKQVVVDRSRPSERFEWNRKRWVPETYVPPPMPKPTPNPKPPRPPPKGPGVAKPPVKPVKPPDPRIP